MRTVQQSLGAAMDFQALVDSMTAMSCVVSVEKVGDGYGAVRIVTGNRAYIDSIEHPAEGVEMLTTEFVPNSEYTRYLTQDLNFENYCFISAVRKRCLHSYVNPERIPVWFDLTFLPLDADEGNLSYCLYTMEINLRPDTTRMSTIPGAIASKVLEMAVKLSESGDFKLVMEDVIKDIRSLCSAQDCCILLVDDYVGTCSVLCEDFTENAGIVPMETLLSDDSFEITRSWDEIIAGSNCFIVVNENDKVVARKRSPKWFAEFEASGAENILLFPLKSVDQTIGYIWVVNFDPKRTIEIKETLEVTSFVLASHIANYLMLKQLRTLSSHDMLTGVQNSNELGRVVKDIAAEASDETVGILIADLNGLKNVNDSGGHSAGDALLRKAGQALLDVFKPDQAFRAGGDEFAIVMRGVDESEMAEKAAAFRKTAKDRGVSVAIGLCVACGADVQEAMRTADARMYDDKRAFYELPENDRRSRSKR